jgi:hypothetical protein
VCPSSALLLCLVVEKSKKCLDFSATLFFLHLLACSVYEVEGFSSHI